MWPTKKRFKALAPWLARTHLATAISLFSASLSLAGERASFQLEQEFQQPDNTRPYNWYAGEANGFSTGIVEVRNTRLRMERNEANDSGTSRRIAYTGTGSERWRDYEVVADAVNSHADNRIGVLARWQGPDNPNQAYVAFIRGDQLFIEKDLDGPDMGQTQLASTQLNRAIEAEETLRLVFAVIGIQLEAEVFAFDASGELEESLGRAAAVDETYASGSAGLASRLTFRSRWTEWDRVMIQGTRDIEPSFAYNEDFQHSGVTAPPDWYDGREDRFSTGKVQLLDGRLRMERDDANDSGVARRIGYAGDGATGWRDYEVEALLVNNNADNRPGLLARWQGPDNPNQAYVAFVRGDQLLIEKDLDGPDMGQTQLASAQLIRTIEAGETLRFVFAVSGTQLVAEVFAVASAGGVGERLGQATATDATYATGSIGLASRLTFRGRWTEWERVSVEGRFHATEFTHPPGTLPPNWGSYTGGSNRIRIAASGTAMEFLREPGFFGGTALFAWYESDDPYPGGSRVPATEWTNYRVETRFRSTHMTSNSTSNGIVLRFQESSGAMFGSEGYHGTVRRVDDDTVELKILKDFENTIGQTGDAGGDVLASRRIDFTLSDDASYALMFEAVGEQLVLGFSAVGAEKQYYLHVEDDTYARGAPGLRSYHGFYNRRTLWDRFAVTRLSHDPLSPHSLWHRQWTCADCTHTIEANSETEREQKTTILRGLREAIAETPVRKMGFEDFVDHAAYVDNLRLDGRFEDLIELEASDPGEARQTALQRLASLSQDYHWVLGDGRRTDPTLRHKIFRSIAYYAKREADNPGLVETWHQPSFLVPSLATNLFFFFLPEMEAVEANPGADPLATAVYNQLQRLALQAFTERPRNDHTDGHPVSPERFRLNSRWVSANGIGYRPVLEVAALMLSPEMMDTVAYVAGRAHDPTSHKTVEDGSAFWNEGITADGLGWGHGRQNYTEYYPWHGMADTSNNRGATSAMGLLREWGWPNLPGIDTSGVVNFLRGSTWLHYKGWRAPVGQGRYTFRIQSSSQDRLLAVSYANNVRYVFADELQDEVKTELRDLNDRGGVGMDGYPAGRYTGARYFYNNDALARKDESFYFWVSMTSSRIDGVESYDWGDFDKLNLFNTDGHYSIMRNGDEYNRHKGAWEVTALPGITARFTPVAELTAESNYVGFNSIHNFAGGVARGENGASAFIYEKNDDTLNTHDPEIYGIYARKSYFVIGDTVFCLGTGIEDKRPDLGGDVWTTLNQTAWRTDLQYGIHGEGSAESFQPGATVARTTPTQDAASAIWARQDGILYAVFPRETSGAVELSAREKSTHWGLLTNREIQDERLDLFRLSINHGPAPQDATYSYLLYAGDRSTDDYLSNRPVETLANTEALQAVASSDGSIVQAVFYDPATTLQLDSWSLRVSHPAIVMAEEEAGSLFLTVSDPRQDPSLDSIEVVLDRPVQGAAVTEHDGLWIIDIPMPPKPRIGEPVTVELTLPPQPGSADHWRAQHFTEPQLADPDIAGWSAAPAGDGVANLIKYHLDLDPMRPAPPPLLPRLDYEPSSPQAIFRYWRRKDPMATVGTVVWTTDLFDGSWSASGVETEIVEQTERRELVEARVETSAHPQLFLRLQVEMKNPPADR